MRPLKTITLMLALAAGASTASPSGSQEMAVKEGAKGMFFQQLSKPAETMNTGVRYWIEMSRGGRTSRVTNRATFRAGDHIRFHVRPNIDGFAYILLRNGSRGEQSILFPNEKSNESNRIRHGQEYIIPQGSGWLTFDEFPGTEKLTLLLSRNSIDATAYLQKPTDEPTVIASAQTGSKDLVPAKVLVVCNDVKPAWQGPKTLIPLDKVQIAKILELEHSGTRTTKRAAKTRTTTTHSSTRVLAAASADTNEDNVTTVVRNEPGGVLFVDVALDHE